MLFENYDLYWLSDDIKQWNIELPKYHWIVFTIDTNLRFYMKVLIEYSIEKYSYTMSKHEFVNFLTKLFYHKF